MELSDATEKTPVTPSGIDPGTFRLVAQCLNHYATPGPTVSKYDYQKEKGSTGMKIKAGEYRPSFTV
jgi:hypothetical protein